MNTGMSTNNESQKKTVDALNELLRGEISAVETFEQALGRLTDYDRVSELRDCLTSHQQRVSFLRSQIVGLGGQPSDGSGPWGAFAKLVQGGAKLFGPKAAIAALEEGEDHGLKSYKRQIDELEPSTRAAVEQNCYAEQRRTHDVVSALKDAMH